MATSTFKKGMVIDPVCGMTVEIKNTPRMVHRSGSNYFFCSPNCMSSFRKSPDKYLQPKGFFGRFFDRLAKTNDKAFGPSGPSCH